MKHENLDIQKYFNTKITKEERQLIFQLRAEVTNVKMNCKGKYKDIRCEACNQENETQEYVLTCEILNKN